MKKILAAWAALVTAAGLVTASAAAVPATVTADSDWAGNASWTNASFDAETNLVVNIDGGYQVKLNAAANQLERASGTYKAAASSVVIPSVVNGTEIKNTGVRIFGDNNANLRYAVVSEGIELLGGAEFQNCRNLEGARLPSTLKTIKNNAFDGCYALASLTLPEGLLSLENTAFKDCRALTSVTIPASLSTVTRAAFMGCTGLESVIFCGVTNAEGVGVETNNQAAFQNTPNLRTVIFLGASAPAVLSGFGTAGADDNVTVYYPADGAGYDSAAFRNAFRAGTEFHTLASVSGKPNVGAVLSGTFPAGQSAVYYWERAETPDFAVAERIGEAAALPSGGIAEYTVQASDRDRYLRFCAEAYGETFTSAATAKIGAFDVTLLVNGAVNGTQFDASGTEGWGAGCRVYNASAESVNICLVSAWYSENRLVDVVTDTFTSLPGAG
ncbi:MAG: leucine-rich repeat domain-containing protein, partial [Clostridiales bacterium]|nr:leucine-rich repeat domain-containing protein [Clostridiales bacterium]